MFVLIFMFEFLFRSRSLNTTKKYYLYDISSDVYPVSFVQVQPLLNGTKNETHGLEIQGLEIQGLEIQGLEIHGQH